MHEALRLKISTALLAITDRVAIKCPVNHQFSICSLSLIHTQTPSYCSTLFLGIPTAILDTGRDEGKYRLYRASDIKIGSGNPHCMKY